RVLFVPGNHEYYQDPEGWFAELERLGMRVLRNQRVAIGGLDVAGVDDECAAALGGGGGPDLERALAGRDPARELVLLSHRPSTVREAARRGVGLQLSGHTHGGQMFPWTLVERWLQPLHAGLAIVDGTQLHVSSGAAEW